MPGEACHFVSGRSSDFPALTSGLPRIHFNPSDSQRLAGFFRIKVVNVCGRVTAAGSVPDLHRVPFSSGNAGHLKTAGKVQLLREIVK